MCEHAHVCQFLKESECLRPVFLMFCSCLRPLVMCACCSGCISVIHCCEAVSLLKSLSSSSKGTKEYSGKYRDVAKLGLFVFGFRRKLILFKNAQVFMWVIVTKYR